ncbi:hypothetical protein [Natronoglomus mannanivorans]|uniref:hypothetical protein n=1 Tax=Natronoglomus mannanivorans TaxID=2979990 RepID=UPI003082F947
MVAAIEPLATGSLEGEIRTTSLRIQLDDGIGRADHGRFDVRWSTTGDYNIHYTDDLDRNLRWDVHPHDFPAPTGDEHYHPPPNAASDPDSVEGSCITVREVELVARATVTLWRDAYDRGSVNGANELVDPP